MRGMGPYSLLEAVGGPGLHARHIGVGENFCAAVLADILGVVADQAVALARDPMLDLARRRELEAFLDAALGLELGHFLSFARTSERVIELPRQPFRPGRSVCSRGLEERGPIEREGVSGKISSPAEAPAQERGALYEDRC